MTRLYKATARFLKDEGGASLIEYSILIGIITVGSIALISGMGIKVKNWWTTLDNATNPAPATPTPTP